MSHAPAADISETSFDAIDTIAGIAPGSRLAALRAERPDVVRHAQTSYEALITPADPADVSLAERAAIALRVAVLERDTALTVHYRQRLAELRPAYTAEAIERFPLAAPLPARLAAVLHQAERLTLNPAAANKSHIDELLQAGLQPRDIVTVSQLIAFVTFQIRLLVGLRLLGAAA